MKTDQITFSRDGYGKRKGDEQAHHINNRNGVVADMSVDFDRRVVWVTTDRDEYFVPFSALCMIQGKREDAPPLQGANQELLAQMIGDSVRAALMDALAGDGKQSKGSKK